jgi:hypothetical protein
MKAALKAWAHVYRDDLTLEQQASLEWTIDSIDRQFVHNSLTGDDYQTRGTLFSGWRLTTFMNTALNYAYLAHCNINTHMSYSLHNGDDVLGCATNVGSIINLLDEVAQTGIRAQVTKMNIGTIAEFLRMDFNSTAPTTRQYLTRACSTFVHSRIESDAPNNQRSVYSAIQTRSDEIIARGGCREVVDRLVSKQVAHANKIFASLDHYGEYIQADIVAGGICNNGCVRDFYFTDEPLEADVDVDLTPLDPGIRDYTAYIARKLPGIRAAVSVEHTRKSLQTSFNIKRCRIVKEMSSRHELTMYRSLKQAWRSVIRIGTFSKARMTSPDLILALAQASAVHAHALMKSHDPYRAISIMV